MLKKRFYLIPVIAVICLLAACSVQEIVNAPVEVTAVLTEPTETTEPIRNAAEAPAQETEPEDPVPETVAETEHTHDWTETVIAPTCINQGYTDRTCHLCGETERDSFVAPTSHVWSSWETVAEATETAEGKAERQCCFCAATESRVLPVQAPSHTHAYAETVTAGPTCTKVGTVTFTCSCGDRYTNDIPRLAHSYSVKTVSPTCKLRGYDVFTCTVCSNSYSDNYTPATGHKHTGKITTPAKCLSNGVKTFTCSCGDTYTETVSATGHTWGSWKTTMAATVTSTGLKERTCSGCGAKETEVIEKIPHTHSHTGKITTPAKCLSNGVKTFTCSCGDTYTETVSATGHTWGSWKTTVAATVTSTGLKERTCSGCGAKETEVIEKIPHTHSHTGKITTPAKCLSNGVKTFTCSCGDTYTETVSATGHTWGSWKTTAEPTYSAAGTRQRTCSACKAVETEGIPQLEHSHSMVHIKTKPTCTQEGYTTHRCSLCGYTYVDSRVSANGHAWNQWTTVTPATDIATGLAKRTCSVCAAEDTKILPKDPNAHTHSYGIVVEYVEPGCNSDGYQKKACSCGDIRKEVLPAAHDWQHHHEDEVGHYDVYIVCHCGWRCSAAGDYISRYAGHINSLPADEKWTHSYYDTGVWVVDIPARDWDQCTVCGATK